MGVAECLWEELQVGYEELEGEQYLLQLISVYELNLDEYSSCKRYVFVNENGWQRITNMKVDHMNVILKSIIPIDF